MQQAGLPSSSISGIFTKELTIADELVLQCFFEGNPDYFFTVHGCPPESTEARNEVEEDEALVALDPGFLQAAGGLVEAFRVFPRGLDL